MKKTGKRRKVSKKKTCTLPGRRTSVKSHHRKATVVSSHSRKGKHVKGHSRKSSHVNQHTRRC